MLLIWIKTKHNTTKRKDMLGRQWHGVGGCGLPNVGGSSEEANKPR